MELRLTAGIVFRLFRNLGDLLGTIFAGATPAGRELLLMLNGVVARTNAFLESPKGQTALADYFKSAMPTIIEIAKLVRDVGKAFLQLAGDPSVTKLVKQIRTELVPAFGDLLQTANKNMPALIGAFTQLTKLAEQIIPSLAVTADALGTVAGAVADFLKANPAFAKFIQTVLGLATGLTLVLVPLRVVGGLLGPLLKPLVGILKVFGKIVPLLVRLAPLLGGVLLTAVEALAGGIIILVGAIGIVPIIIAAVVAGIAILIYNSETVRSFLLGVGQAILDFFKAIPGFLGAAIATIGGWLSGLGGMFKTAWDAAIEAVKAAITLYIQFVTFLPRKTIAALVALAGLLGGFFRRVWNAAVNIVKTIVSGYIAFVTAIPGRILAGLQILGSLLWNLANAAWNRFKSAMVTVATAVIEFVRALPGRISSNLGALGELLYGKGKDVLEGLWDGMKAVWEKIKGWLSGLGKKIKSLKGPIEVDRTLLVDEGRAIMDGFQKGLKERWSGVEGFLESRGGFIKGILNASGLGHVEDAIGKLFSGEMSLGDVTGVIDKESNGGLHPSSGLADTTQMANMLAKRFGLVVTSILRSGAITTTGNRSQHADGMAADLSNGSHPTPEMDALYAFASRLLGKVFHQILYRTMVGGNHFNHVHLGWLARRQGGRVQKHDSYMTGENGPEPFFPDQNGFILSHSKFNRLLALGDRVRSLEMSMGPRASGVAGAAQGVTQVNNFDVTLEHRVNDANSLMSILGTRLDSFAKASLPSLAGGVQ